VVGATGPPTNPSGGFPYLETKHLENGVAQIVVDCNLLHHPHEIEKVRLVHF